MPGEIRFVYTGAAGPIMPHALNVLFGALQSYRARVSGAERFRFHFLGTSYVAKGMGHQSVLPVAKTWKVDDLVFSVPHRIGYFESLKSLLTADALLLLGSSDPAYSPSKLYPYYLSGKPMLSVVFRDSYLIGLLTELDCSLIAPFALDAPCDAAHAAIHRFFDQALAGFPPAMLPQRNDTLFTRAYLAEVLTARQCELFEQVLAGDRANG